MGWREPATSTCCRRRRSIPRHSAQRSTPRPHRGGSRGDEKRRLRAGGTLPPFLRFKRRRRSRLRCVLCSVLLRHRRHRRRRLYTCPTTRTGTTRATTTQRSPLRGLLFRCKGRGESLPPRRSPSVSASPFARGWSRRSLLRRGAELTLVDDGPSFDAGGGTAPFRTLHSMGWRERTTSTCCRRLRHTPLILLDPHQQRLEVCDRIHRCSLRHRLHHNRGLHLCRRRRWLLMPTGRMLRRCLLRGCRLRRRLRNS